MTKRTKKKSQKCIKSGSIKIHSFLESKVIEGATQRGRRDLLLCKLWKLSFKATASGKGFEKRDLSYRRNEQTNSSPDPTDKSCPLHHWTNIFCDLDRVYTHGYNHPISFLGSLAVFIESRAANFAVSIAILAETKWKLSKIFCASSLSEASHRFVFETVRCLDSWATKKSSTMHVTGPSSQSQNCWTSSVENTGLLITSVFIALKPLPKYRPIK